MGVLASLSFFVPSLTQASSSTPNPLRVEVPIKEDMFSVHNNSIDGGSVIMNLTICYLDLGWHAKLKYPRTVQWG